MGEGESQEAAANKYTFGDNLRASARLRRLAEMYEPESRELLRRSGINAPRLAVDLGCGPGWSTRLLQDVLKPDRTVGLDASAVFVEEARTRSGQLPRTPFRVRHAGLVVGRAVGASYQWCCLDGCDVI